MVEELASLYVDGLEPVTRRALDAASVVRRTTLSLLQAMLPDEDPADLFARLRALPFVELGAEGLLVHDAVRAATSALLRAADPARHRAHRSAAWTRLRAELRTAGGVGPVALHRGHALPRGEPDRAVRVLPERLRRRW